MENIKQEWHTTAKGDKTCSTEFGIIAIRTFETIYGGIGYIILHEKDIVSTLLCDDPIKYAEQYIMDKYVAIHARIEALKITKIDIPRDTTVTGIPVNISPTEVDLHSYIKEVAL